EAVKKEILAAKPTPAIISSLPNMLRKSMSMRSTKNTPIKPTALVDVITQI
ncbi:MAG: hypothetical protein ACJAYG_001891, partial [Oceanicoccus sp.]